MRLRLFVIPWMMTMMACQNSGTDGSATDQGAECSKSPDMIASQPSCAAAKGLTGDNLLCVDFSNAQNTITNLTAQGWKFNAEATGNCAGWQVTNNLLQVNMFSMLSGSCALTLPSLTSSQIQQHSRLTLSIQHRLDLGDPQQQARIFLNDDTDGQNVLWQDTAQRNVPRQQTVITVDKADLPVLLQTGFTWFLKLSSTGAFAYNGWQIESVALMGEP